MLGTRVREPMRDLFRRASFLFWQYPRLWLPVLVADAASYAANQVRASASHQIVLWIDRRHLDDLRFVGGIPYSPSALREATLLVSPLQWGGYFLSIFMYASALLLTSAALYRIAQTGSADFRSPVLWTRSSLKRIARFSLKLLVLCFSSAMLLLPISSLPLANWGFAGQPLLFGFAFAIGAGTCIAWLITPSALRLIQTSEFGHVSAYQLRIGRLVAIFGVVASNVIGAVLTQVRLPLWNGWQRHAGTVRYGIGTIESAMAITPYVLVFITLFLIANPDNPLNLLPVPGLVEHPAPLPPSTAE